MRAGSPAERSASLSDLLTEERDAVLRHLASVEPLLRATAAIDATAPVERVVQQMEGLAEAGRETGLISSSCGSRPTW